MNFILLFQTAEYAAVAAPRASATMPCGYAADRTTNVIHSQTLMHIQLAEATKF